LASWAKTEIENNKMKVSRVVCFIKTVLGLKPYF
jgi:hypothetical protein